MTKILAISGSLRNTSTNTVLLHAAALIAPQGVEVTVYEGIGDLPLFNPDIEGEDYDRPAPATVQDFRARLQAADGVMIASPEYAHGVSGVVKNALDWLVGSGEFVDKPIVVFNASPRATIALEALKETVRIMGGIINEEASITLPILGSNLDAQGIAANPEISSALRTAITVFANGIEAGPLKAAGSGF